MSAAETMIRVTDLRFAYPGGDFALSIPELAVGKGERVAVIGPSGAGKSTLLNLIAGVNRPDAGVVRVGEIEVSALDDRRSRAFRASAVGFVFQDFGLLDYLTARDNILHPYRICAALRLSAEVRARAGELAERLGVEGRLGHRPDALSQGEKQRVAICRALLARPQVILADEATGNLDPENKQAIVDLLFEAVAQEDATLVAVTHDREIVERFDRVIDFRALAAAA
jgi:putative ABC transport system ATP-binding protein